MVTPLDWLLAADPSIRWQAMRDLADAPPDAVAAERARVATEGWGARLLALQLPDGRWEAGRPGPEFAALLGLLQLRDLGLDPASGAARDAVGRVREHVTWTGPGPWGGTPVFAGEVEPCINGRVLALGAYFGLEMSPLVERLLGEQMADGGWNCEQENGSVRGSFDTTINVLEGLLEHARANGDPGDVSAALARGQAYLLDRGLLRRRSTGEPIDAAYSRFSYPTGYHYDVLRGLDHLRAAGVRPDARAAEAIELVRSRCGPDGRWPLEHPHAVELVNTRVRDLGLDMDEHEGRPSRWNTLRALRVLRWYDQRR